MFRSELNMMTPLSIVVDKRFTDDEKMSILLSNYEELFSLDNCILDAHIIIIVGVILEIIIKARHQKQ